MSFEKTAPLSVDEQTEQGGASQPGPDEEDDTTNKDALPSPRPAFEPAVVALVSFAGGLVGGRMRGEDALSTSLLLFALAESQTEAAPNELRSDSSASLFAGAVHALAKDGYERTWAEYFSPTFRPATGMTPPTQSPPETPNVGKVLTNAAGHMKAASRSAISSDDLIIALLNFTEGGHRATLEKMGVSMPDLLDAYKDAKVGQIGTTLLNDVASIEDRLEYGRYANAITDFLLNAETPPPLSVSIQAPWGAGKSSLMQQIREKLDPREIRIKKGPNDGEIPSRLFLGDVLIFLDQKSDSPKTNYAETNKLWTIWFNAWKYDSSEQVWAGLVDAIVDQVSGRLTTVEREKFLLRLQLSRIDDGIIRKKIYDRVITIWWEQVRRWTFLGAAAISAFVGIEHGAKSLLPEGNIERWIGWTPYAPLAILALYLSRSYFKSGDKVRREPAAFSLSDYLKVPPYDLNLGTIHHIHDDLLRVLKTTPVKIRDGKEEPTPLVIFIDDLDRCSPSKVATVVEGVSMFLASEDYKCIFVIGMDPQMIAAALEDAHSKVRSQLPRYERTVPLGWRFMDKFIQLPFTIPPSNGEALSAYVDWLSGSSIKQPSNVAPHGPVISDVRVAPDLFSPHRTDEEFEMQRPSGTGTTRAEETFAESREVGQIIREAAANTSGNPREIKRLANLTRLYLGLRNERRIAKRGWRSPSPSQYARWIVLTLKWPDMLRWLQWGADEFAWPAADLSADLTTRRLRFLEDAVRKGRHPSGWTKVLATSLKVPGADESDWATDPKLFEFFANEAALEPEARLSAAASMGFW